MMRKVMAFAGAALLAMTPAVSAQSDDASLEAAQAVQKHVDAYRSGNLDRFVATFAEDATVAVGGMEATGHSQIRAFYASNFADEAPHSIRIVDSSMQDGWVMVTTAYTFSDGIERCCSYSQYEVRDGKITYLAVSMQTG